MAQIELPWYYGILIALISGGAIVLAAWFNSRSNVHKTTVEELRKELQSCKAEAAHNLEIERNARRALELIVNNLKDDLGRKNEELINALINRQQYLRRAEDLKDDNK